jgi:hypothetical protein
VIVPKKGSVVGPGALVAVAKARTAAAVVTSRTVAAAGSNVAKAQAAPAKSTEVVKSQPGLKSSRVASEVL